MAINPMALMKMKQRLEIFQQDHPKVFPFFNSLSGTGMLPGTIYEVKVTTTDGRERIMNFRLTENDSETIRMLMSERAE